MRLIKHAWDDERVPWSEDDIQMAVARDLRRLGVLFAADQNAGRRSWKEGAKRKAMGMAAGEPDLRLYLPGGALVMVELKTAKGRLSAIQAARHRRLKNLGFEVHTVAAKTPADAITQVRGIINGRHGNAGTMGGCDHSVIAGRAW